MENYALIFKDLIDKVNILLLFFSMLPKLLFSQHCFNMDYIQHMNKPFRRTTRLSISMQIRHLENNSLIKTIMASIKLVAIR